MKTAALNLLLVDDNTLIAGQLSKYLNNRFGKRINVLTFIDTDTCIQNINQHSHVIILDYFLNEEEKAFKNGLKHFNSIKKINHRTKVTILTSNSDVATATEEMQKETSDYIIKWEKSLQDIFQRFDKVIVRPVKTVVTYPVMKIVEYYNINNYLMMFLVAFISIGAIVLAVFLSLQLFR
jgi:DNA-binding NtrC family response regulator